MNDQPRNWPADKIERWPTHKLLAYQRNARTHSEEQVEQIANSMKEFGWTVPILVDEAGIIIAGHGRTLAAAKLGISDVPVMVAKGWTEAQKMAYRLADNKLPEAAGWDTDMLKLELTELGKMNFDLALTGFDDVDFVQFIATPPEAKEPEDAPPLPDNPVTLRGDVWVMGKHRIMCGDSTTPLDVAKLLAGRSVDMLLTDPPYCSGGFQEAGKSAGSVGTRGTEMVANDTLSTRGYMALMKAVIPQFDAGVAYVFTDWRMWINLFDVVESSGYGVRNMVVWDKGSPGMGAGWRMQHELIMCGIRVKSPFNPKKAQGNVIQSKRTGNKLHATEKPVDLLETIMNVTDMAKTVADPFCGSGSTVIAGEITGRSVFAMELMPNYCDVTVQRWQTYAESEAILEETGQTFAEVAESRSKPAKKGKK